MTVVNIGSINRDFVFRVSHFPTAGETIEVQDFHSGLGGKGLNQSVAIARAGGSVIHVGAVGFGDEALLDQIETLGVETKAISESTTRSTGQANVYINSDGDNAIVINAGANADIPEMPLSQVLEQSGTGDWLLFQNEVKLPAQTISQAKACGLKIAYCAAPFDAEAVVPLLEHIDLLSVNEIELAQLEDSCSEALVEPQFDLLITLGERGAEFRSGGVSEKVAAYRVKPIDTTGAGDTFLGYFLANYTDGTAVATCLEIASRAAALQVTRLGAANVIPTVAEVDGFAQPAPPKAEALQ
ncbi:ribokinase [Shimia sp.]|uniref:ribokinase n=1 Tax=Shimia sp. TaxID=1954381 RepID=UPI0032980358